MLSLLAASPAAFIATALVLGLIVGSFLNVVIHRLPIMLERQWRRQCAEETANGAPPPEEPPFNLVVPRSACPHCQAPITALQNIPVLSYLALRGRCAHCRARIRVRYPLVELLTGLASAAVAWRFGFGWPAACGLTVTWFLVALAFIDLDRQLLPDALTLPLLWLGLLASVTGWATPILAAAPGTLPPNLPVGPADAILGATSGYLCLWAVYHFFRLATGKEGMGYGDFKLLAALCAWLGWRMLLPIVLLSALVGALVGIGLIVTRRQGRGQPMPFGPFLAAAGWVAMLWGPQLTARYLGLYGSG